MAEKIQSMTPKEIVAELDKYIIGQDEAKKSVAIALRNRSRRSLLSDGDESLYPLPAKRQYAPVHGYNRQ